MKNCLKCPIYWNDTVHECVCEQCNDKDFSEAYVDICHEMPPLLVSEDQRFGVGKWELNIFAQTQ